MRAAGRGDSRRSRRPAATLHPRSIRWTASVGAPSVTSSSRLRDHPTSRGARVRSPEAGMTTAELLGNAALGIAALVAIWAVMQTLGLDVVDWIRGQLRV